MLDALLGGDMLSARRPTELEVLLEVDEKCTRLQALRRLLVCQLALLGALLWIAALGPAKLAQVQAIVVWLWMAAAGALVIVSALELAARWRFRCRARWPNGRV